MKIKDEPTTNYDDPIWEFIVRERLKPYIPYFREWWSHVSDIEQTSPGTYMISRPGTDDPAGMMYRVSPSAHHTLIKNIQVFTFVPVPYLQIRGVAGGVTKMVERVCGSGIKMDEFTVLVKSNLKSTYNQGQILIIIPTDIYEGRVSLGRYVYLSVEELEALCKGVVPKTVVVKAEKHKRTS